MEIPVADLSSSTWSEIADNNTSAPPDGWPEGMARSAVNNAARELMGANKRSWNRDHAVKTTGGTSTAYTLTYDVPPLAYAQGLAFRCYIHADCGASPTLNVNNIGPKAIRRLVATGNAVLPAGDLVLGDVVELIFDTATDSFFLLDAPRLLGADGRVALKRAPAEMAMVLLQTVGVSVPVLGVNFTFPGSYTEYELRFSNVVPTSSPAPGLRLSLTFPGNPTPGASEYYTFSRYRSKAGGTIEYEESSTSGNIGSVVRFDAGQERMSGYARLTALGAGDQYSHVRGDVLLMDNNSVGTGKYWNRVDSSVVVQRQAVPNGMGVFFAGTSITAGVFRLFGIR